MELGCGRDCLTWCLLLQRTGLDPRGTLHSHAVCSGIWSLHCSVGNLCTYFYMQQALSSAGEGMHWISSPCVLHFQGLRVFPVSCKANGAEPLLSWRIPGIYSTGISFTRGCSGSFPQANWLQRAQLKCISASLKLINADFYPASARIRLRSPGELGGSCDLQPAGFALFPLTEKLLVSRAQRTIVPAGRISSAVFS